MEGRTWMVQAADSENSVLPLDHPTSACMFPVEFALLTMRVQDKPLADAEKLVEALVKVLRDFAPLAGRLAKSDGQSVVLCSNGGVAFSWGRIESEGPSFIPPLDSSLFNHVRSEVLAAYLTGEAEAAAAEEPLLRIQVTDFEDSQVIAFSACSLIADVTYLGEFVAAWSHAFRGEEHTTPARSPGAYFDGMLASDVRAHESLVGVSWVRSKEDCKDILQRCRSLEGICETANSKEALPVHALVSAEALLAHAFDGETVGLATTCGAVADSGSARMPFLAVPNTMAAATGLRNFLGTGGTRGSDAKVKPDVVDDSTQYPTACTGHGNAKLCFIMSWMSAFRVTKISFGEDAVEDFMLGMSMVAGQAKAVESAGWPRPCWLLPQRMACVKVLTCMTQAAGDAFVAADQDVDCLSVACSVGLVA